MCYLWRRCRKWTCVPKLVCKILFCDDTTCENDKRSGRPFVADDNDIKTLIKNNIIRLRTDNQCISRLLWNTLCIHLATCLDLDAARFERKKFNRPHLHLWFIARERNKNDPFLKRIITDDEKWIVYTIMLSARDYVWGKWDKPPQSIPKQNLTKKVMLCIWWDWKGIVCYETI